MSGRANWEATPLHAAATPQILRALLERNADPTLITKGGWNALMWHAWYAHHECIACLLEDTRVVESIHAVLEGNTRHSTALHIACSPLQDIAHRAPTLRLLLAAGADPRMLDEEGRTPLQILKSNQQVNQEAMAVLEDTFLDDERAAALIRLRRLVIKKQGAELREEGDIGEKEAMLAFVVGLGEGGGCNVHGDYGIAVAHVVALAQGAGQEVNAGLGMGCGGREEQQL